MTIHFTPWQIDELTPSERKAYREHCKARRAVRGLKMSAASPSATPAEFTPRIAEYQAIVDKTAPALRAAMERIKG